MKEAIPLSVEDFEKHHPGLNPNLFTEHARVALAHHHNSPAPFRLFRGAEEFAAIMSFTDPEPRPASSLERERFVELGAIVMAGLLLAHFEGKQITRVTKRGSRVDYFVGERRGERCWILEVGGTDEGSLASLRNDKHEQLRQSPYRLPPHRKDGFVAATRFAPVAASALDPVPAPD